MPDAAHLSAGQLAAWCIEGLLCAAGLCLMWRLRPNRPAAPASPLDRRPMSVIELLALLILVFSSTFVVLTVTGHALKGTHLSTNQSMVVESTAFPAGVLIGVALFVFAGRRMEKYVRPAVGRTLLGGAATFLILTPAVLAALFVGHLLLVSLGIPEKEQELVDIWEAPHLGAYRWLFVVTACVLAPIAEEWIFRGGFFRFLRNRIPRWMALLFPALLFGAMHVDWPTLTGLPSFLPLVTLALVFSLAYERTGNLGTTMVAHALFNLNTLFMLAVGIGS